MWNKLLDVKLGMYMVRVTGGTEDDETIYKFFEHIENRIQDYKVVVVLATQWKTYDDMKQANLAIKFAGMYHASRFIIMMDYLADKFEKGELK